MVVSKHACPMQNGAPLSAVSYSTLDLGTGGHVAVVVVVVAE